MQYVGVLPLPIEFGHGAYDARGRIDAKHSLVVVDNREDNITVRTFIGIVRLQLEDVVAIRVVHFDVFTDRGIHVHWTKFRYVVILVQDHDRQIQASDSRRRSAMIAGLEHELVLGCFLAIEQLLRSQFTRTLR